MAPLFVPFVLIAQFDILPLTAGFMQTTPLPAPVQTGPQRTHTHTTEIDKKSVLAISILFFVFCFPAFALIDSLIEVNLHIFTIIKMAPNLLAKFCHEKLKRNSPIAIIF